MSKKIIVVFVCFIVLLCSGVVFAKLKSPDLAVMSDYRIVDCRESFNRYGESKCFEVKIQSLAAPILLNHPLKYVVEYSNGMTLRTKFSDAEWNNIRQYGWTWARIGRPLAPGKFGIRIVVNTWEFYPEDKNHDNDKRTFNFVIPAPKYNIELLNVKKLIHGNTCKVGLVLRRAKGPMPYSKSVKKAYMDAMEKGWISVSLKSGSEHIVKRYYLKDIFQGNYDFGRKVFELPDYSFDLGTFGRNKKTIVFNASLHIPSAKIYTNFVAPNNAALLIEENNGNTIRKTVKCEKYGFHKPPKTNSNNNFGNKIPPHKKPRIGPTQINKGKIQNFGGFQTSPVK